MTSLRVRFGSPVIAGLILGAVVASAASANICASRVLPGNGVRLEEPAFKGVELFSWKVDGAFRFSLLWGTNRRKTEQEIKAADCVLADIAELKAALGRLARHESVLWFDAAPSVELALPTRDVLEEVQRYARIVQLELVLPPRHGE